jgi:hypothetical protein
MQDLARSAQRKIGIEGEDEAGKGNEEEWRIFFGWD